MMENEFILSIDINLQSLSMLSLAKALWAARDVKESIRDHFRSMNAMNHSLHRYKDWYPIVKKVILKLQFFKLPYATLKKLQDLIVFMGENLYDWNEFVTFELGLTLPYIEETYWAPYGTIDDLKILKLSWLKLGAIQPVNTSPNPYFNANENLIYVLASINADEEFLHDSLPEMTNEMRRIYPDVEMDDYKDKIYTFISLWLYFNFCDRMPANMPHNMAVDIIMRMNRPMFMQSRRINFFSSDYIIPIEYMLKLCVEKSLVKAAKYFFNKLNRRLQQGFLTECLSTVTRHFSPFDTNKRLNHGSRKLCELMNFFVTKMNKEQILKFSDQHQLSMIKANLNYYWLYPEMIWPFLNLDCSSNQIDSNIHFRPYRLSDKNDFFFEVIISKIREDHEADCPTKKPVLKDLLFEAWDSIPNYCKDKIFKEVKPFRGKDISTIFEIFDFEFMTSLFSDTNLGDLREYLIMGAVEKCKKLIKEQEYFLVIEFIRDVLPSKERDTFYTKIGLLENLIIKDKFETADLFISILSRCIEDKTRAEIKKSVDHNKICNEFVLNYKLELAEKYLQWQFDEIERKRFRSSLQSHNRFIKKVIFDIWKNSDLDKDTKIKRCFNTLMFYFESEEMVNKYRKERKFDLFEDDNLRDSLLTQKPKFERYFRKIV